MTIPPAMPSFGPPLFRAGLALLVWWCFSVQVEGQIATESWQDQSNYTRSVDVASEGALTLVACETAVYGMLLDDSGLPTGELQRFGKSQGLSRADIVAVALAGENQWAIVAYSEGTFDLIGLDADGTLSEVLTVVDLAEADLLGDKQPRNLVVVDDRLLICTDIGVVEFDLVALEVRDTWKLEKAGSLLSVRSIVREGDRWWAATNQGVWSAEVGAPFLGNPASWEQEGGLLSLGVADVLDIVTLGSGQIVVAEQREGPDAVWLRSMSDGGWSNVSQDMNEEWRQLTAFEDRFWATTPYGFMSWNGQGEPGDLVGQVGPVFMQPSAIAATDNGLWLANGHTGAFRLDFEGGGYDGPIAPNGPLTNSCFRMDAWNEWLWVASGGTDASGVPLYRQEGFSGRKNSFWRQISPPQGEVGGDGVQDPMDVSIDPTAPERAVFGSLEEGLVEIQEQQVSGYWNPNNSPLGWNLNWDVPRCAVPTLDFDRQGNLWVANEGTESPLKMLDAEGNWHVFDIDGLDVSTEFNRIFATQSDQVWMLLGDGKGVAVLATQGTPTELGDDDVRFLRQGEGQGGLPSPFVYAVEEDLDGEVWVGTLQGPAVFYQPASIFGPDPVDAQQILIEQDGNFQYLLETEIIRDIALDGGNRKWLATVNSGVFLLSPDGREQEERFTADNSPILANEVYDIAIDQSSGMVYFSTPNGVTGFRGTATNFRQENGAQEMVVFPNPWRAEYDPVVTMDGLAFGTELHILNAGGERVRKLESAGGRAVWDTLNDQGQPVPSGVYFLLAGEDEGRTGGSGKLVILR
jgi:hypothetical protein